jgi:hypothetical protein
MRSRKPPDQREPSMRSSKENLGTHRTPGPPGRPRQVICSDDAADCERMDCRILDYRICLMRTIVECL